MQRPRQSRRGDQCGPAPSEELEKDWSAIKAGVANIESLIDAHLRRVEDAT